ncbi:MAG: hypothetical protein K9M10_02645 [Candidatus Pacebacteria bacterium]|nr:hypothetical protein [Candidatus Paceibacterota bacterium]MCF7857354.1 hypothetical protein [Candidatus Paceibacterota bacterium]
MIEGFVFAVTLAAIVGIVCKVAIPSDGLSALFAYLTAVLYGAAVYELWVFLMNNCSSLVWEDGAEPVELDLRQTIIAPFLPIAVLLAVFAIAILFLMAYLKYLYDKAQGRHDVVTKNPPTTS